MRRKNTIARNVSWYADSPHQVFCFVTEASQGLLHARLAEKRVGVSRDVGKMNIDSCSPNGRRVT